MTTARFDAQLAAIRMAAHAIPDPKARHEVESARFHLFLALDAGDTESARNWLATLQLAARVIPDWANPFVADALAHIARELQEAPCATRSYSTTCN